MAGLFDAWNKGVASGKEQRRDSILGQYVQPALGGDQAALSQVYGVDPDAGMQLQQFATQQQQQQKDVQQASRKELGSLAQAVVQARQSNDSARLQGTYAALAQKARAMGADVPDQFSDEDLPHIYQFAAEGGAGVQQEVPSAIRELQMLQQNPELAKLDMQRRQAGFERPQLIQTADGYAWATPKGASPLNYGGQQSRTNEVPFTVDPSLPQEVQADIRRTEADGREWTQAPNIGPRVMPAPKQAATSELERRLALASGMGATEEEKKRLVLGNAAPRASDALGGKALPLGAVNGLTKDSAKLTNLQDLSGRFADEFAGNAITGSAENLAGRLGLPGTTPGQAEWWQQYDRYKNEVRNELFGASLTSGEQAAFKAADIDPSMKPSVIRANMKKQSEIIEAGLRRKAKVWAAQGYNRGAIEEATGVSLSRAQQPAQGAVRIQSADDYNRLPSGSLYVAPDGTQRRKK